MVLYYVYKLYCDDLLPNFSGYVSATKSLDECRANHLYNCYDKSSPKYDDELYRKIRNNGGWENWKIDVLYLEDRVNPVKRLVKKNNKRSFITI